MTTPSSSPSRSYKSESKQENEILETPRQALDLQLSLVYQLTTLLAFIIGEDSWQSAGFLDPAMVKEQKSTCLFASHYLLALLIFPINICSLRHLLCLLLPFGQWKDLFAMISFFQPFRTSDLGKERYRLRVSTVDNGCIGLFIDNSSSPSLDTSLLHACCCWRQSEYNGIWKKGNSTFKMKWIRLSPALTK